MNLQIDTSSSTPQKQLILNLQESPIPNKKEENEQSQTENIFGLQEEDSSFVTQMKDLIPHTQREKNQRQSEILQTNDRFVTKKDFQKLKQEIQQLQKTMNMKFDEFVKSNEISTLKENKKTEAERKTQYQPRQRINMQQTLQHSVLKQDSINQKQMKNFKKQFLSQQVSPRNMNLNEMQQSFQLNQYNTEISEEYQPDQKQPKQFNFDFNLEQQERKSNVQSYLKLTPRQLQSSIGENTQNPYEVFAKPIAFPLEIQKVEVQKQENIDQNKKQFEMKIQIQQLQEENLFINKKLQQIKQELQQKGDKLQIKSQEVRSLQDQLIEKQKIIADLIKQNQKLTSIQKNFVKSYEYELQQKQNDNNQLKSYLTQVQTQFSIQVKDLETTLNHSIQKNRKQKEEWSKIYKEMKRENEHMEERLKTKENENQQLKKSLKQLQSLLNNF